jgi:hypothetical protein
VQRGRCRLAAVVLSSHNDPAPLQGYQDEVAAAGSGLASYFSVFHKLLENKIAAVLAVVRRAAEAEDAATAAAGGAGGGTASASAARARLEARRDVAALVKDLRDSCEHSQHTYLHVQVRGVRGRLLTACAGLQGIASEGPEALKLPTQGLSSCSRSPSLPSGVACR